MSANEEYLDQLLKSLDGETIPEEETAMKQEPDITPEIEEILEVEERPEIEETAVIEETPEIEERSGISEEPVLEDANRQMSAEEIARLLQDTNVLDNDDERSSDSDEPIDIFATDLGDAPDSSFAEEEPSIEEELFIEEEPSIEEELFIGEEPAIEEEPIIGEEPAIEEEPFIEEEPSIEEEPFIEEEPSIEEEPIIGEEPSIEEEPFIEEEPSIEEEPFIEAAPEIEEDLVAEDDAEAPNPNKQMTAEEIAQLLQSIPELDDEESDTSTSGEADFDLSSDIDEVDLMDILPEDEGVAEINDLLEKSDSGEAIEEDMLALLAGVDDGDERSADSDEPIDIFASDLGDAPDPALEMDEGAGQEAAESGHQKKAVKGKISKEEKKALKAQQKEKKAAGETEKKPGFFAKLAALFTEEPPEDDITIPPEEADGTADSENLAILQAIDNKPKEEEKSGKKPKKEKKAKKEKAPKKEKEPKEKKAKKEKNPEEASSEKKEKIPFKKILPIILIFASLLAAFFVALFLFPKTSYIDQANDYFKKGNYESAYLELAGWDLNDEEAELYRKSAILVKMQRKSEAHLLYDAQTEMIHVLDALVQAVKYHEKISAEAEAFGISGTLDGYYQTVLDALVEYELPEELAKEFAAIEDSVDYSIALEDFLYGPQELPEVQLDTVTDEAGEQAEEAQTGETASAEETDLAEETDSAEEAALPESDPDQASMPEESDPEGSDSENDAEQQENPAGQSVPQGGNVSDGQEKIMHEFSVEMGPDGKYHGGQ